MAAEHDVNRGNSKDSGVGSVLLSALICLRKKVKNLAWVFKYDGGAQGRDSGICLGLDETENFKNSSHSICCE